VTDDTLNWFRRLLLAWSAFFRVLLEPGFARGVAGLMSAGVTEPTPPSAPAMSQASPAAPPPVAPPPRPAEAALLLQLLQQRGRLVDFLQQDISQFDDATIGVAARAVHEGCRAVLTQQATIEPLRGEPEGTHIAVTEEVSLGSVKLTGRVAGEAPWRGLLVHRGWRLTELRLPARTGDTDPSILAPAEVEL